MEYHKDNLAEIERLRSTLYNLANEAGQYSKVLAVSQELDTHIVKFQKSIMSGFLKCPAPG